MEQHLENSSEAERLPAVSIIIPAYNMASFIREALESVFAQSFADYETIVVNDGSTDNLDEVLEPYKERIVYIRQDNRGLSAARNAGWRLARGKYIALLDADDIWFPDYLKTMAALMEADPAPDLVYPNAVLFGMPQWEGKLYQDIYPTTAQVTLETLLTREANVFISVMYRNAIADTVGLFDEAIRKGGEDFDLWIRMARHGCRLSFTREPLVRYRKRPGQLSNNYQEMGGSAIHACKKLLADPQSQPRERFLAEAMIRETQASINRLIARNKVADRDYAGAVEHLALANSHFRSLKLALISFGLRIAPGFVARIMHKRPWQPTNNSSRPVQD